MSMWACFCLGEDVLLIYLTLMNRYKEFPSMEVGSQQSVQSSLSRLHLLIHSSAFILALVSEIASYLITFVRFPSPSALL